MTQDEASKNSWNSKTAKNTLDGQPTNYTKG